MTGETVRRLDKFTAPYGREVMLDSVTYDSGMHLLRVTIRERSRFTIFELDSETAHHWASVMENWSRQGTPGQHPVTNGG